MCVCLFVLLNICCHLNIIYYILGLIEVEGKSVPEQKVNKLSNKNLNTEIQELNVLLKGKSYYCCRLLIWVKTLVNKK